MGDSSHCGRAGAVATPTASSTIRAAREGDALFTRDVGESVDDEMTGLIRGKQGELYVTGTRTRHDLAVTANGIVVAVASAEGEVELRADIDQGIHFAKGAFATDVAFSDDGDLLLLGSVHLTTEQPYDAFLIRLKQ